jgi:hypothetical protein
LEKYQGRITMDLCSVGLIKGGERGSRGCYGLRGDASRAADGCSNRKQGFPSSACGMFCALNRS